MLDEPGTPAEGPRPWWDTVLVAVLLPAGLVEGFLRSDLPWPAFSIGGASVVVVALLWRRSHPLGATVVAYTAQTVAGLAPVLAGHSYGVLYTTSCFLLFPYSLGRWASGRRAVMGVTFVLAMHVAREPLYDAAAAEIVVGAGFLFFPAALGAAVRFAVSAQRRQMDQIRAREREELARELHDTVAHHVSGIVIQAQAGQAVATAHPEQVGEVLRVIEDAATRSLAEMRTVVGLLRTDGPAERSPVPGIGALAPMVERLATRLEVRLEVDERMDLDPAVDAAVFRLVQESVTNAQRHARRAARVDVSVTAAGDDTVAVTVADDGAAAPRPTDRGWGLTGMAERVDLLGGCFAAGPRPGGGWLVQATLPMQVGRGTAAR